MLIIHCYISIKLWQALSRILLILEESSICTLSRFWKGATILSKADPSLALEVLVDSSAVHAAVYNETGHGLNQKIRFRNSQLALDSSKRVLGTNNDLVQADLEEVSQGSLAHQWELGKPLMQA